LDVDATLGKTRDIDLTAGQPVYNFNLLVKNAISEIVVTIPDNGITVKLFNGPSRIVRVVRSLDLNGRCDYQDACDLRIRIVRLVAPAFPAAEGRCFRFSARSQGQLE
jgi:hypothetical protein